MRSHAKNVSAVMLTIGLFSMQKHADIADDGGISFGGSPHLLSGHPSVTMASEVIDMDIHTDKIKVDCKFVFHNDGPACTVRMGFPDQGEGASLPYEGEPLPKGSKLKATFLTYESYVDGKKVPTKLIPTNDRSLFWHTKTVTFKPKSDCVIRDVYTLEPGGQVTNENGFYKQTSYVLHTGSSWHGPIGKADINVHFEKDIQTKPIILKPASECKPDVWSFKWSTTPEGTVAFDGLATPTVDGNTLHFTKTNFKPTKKDDIHLYYAHKILHNM